MKKVLLQCLLLALPLMGSERSMFPLEPKKQGLKTAIQNVKDELIGDWNFLPYLQMEFIAPGIGICVRSPSFPIKFEINFKASYGIFNEDFAPSISGLYCIPTRNGVIYSGLGGGVFAADSFNGSSGWIGWEFSPLVNMFLGYEGKQGFFDLGVDMIGGSPYVNFPIEESYLSLLPTMRLGWKF